MWELGFFQWAFLWVATGLLILLGVAKIVDAAIGDGRSVIYKKPISALIFFGLLWPVVLALIVWAVFRRPPIDPDLDDDFD